MIKWNIYIYHNRDTVQAQAHSPLPSLLEDEHVFEHSSHPICCNCNAPENDHWFGPFLVGCYRDPYALFKPGRAKCTHGNFILTVSRNLNLWILIQMAKQVTIRGKGKPSKRMRTLSILNGRWSATCQKEQILEVLFSLQRRTDSHTNITMQHLASLLFYNIYSVFILAELFPMNW